MGQKIHLGDQEYDVENLSEQAKTTLANLKFATDRIQELNNMQALLQRAKSSYIESVKQEMLSNKAGLIIENN